VGGDPPAAGRKPEKHYRDNFVTAFRRERAQSGQESSRENFAFCARVSLSPSPLPPTGGGGECPASAPFAWRIVDPRGSPRSSHSNFRAMVPLETRKGQPVRRFDEESRRGEGARFDKTDSSGRNETAASDREKPIMLG
jgi:hypothetical protein